MQVETLLVKTGGGIPDAPVSDGPDDTALGLVSVDTNRFSFSDMSGENINFLCRHSEAVKAA